MCRHKAGQRHNSVTSLNMEPNFTANLKAVVAQALQRCRNTRGETGDQQHHQQQHRRDDDAPQLAYAACLLEAAGAWGGDGSISLHGSSKDLEPAALADMAERVSAHALSPPDPAAAATARLQLALERAFKQQQAAVEREQAAAATITSRLAARLAAKKATPTTTSSSSPQQARHTTSGPLPLYQAVFEGVAEYVAAATPSLQARVTGDDSARRQLAAALSSAFPLSSVACFLTLPAHERLQQLESLARITAGICLFNSHSGNGPSPLSLPAATQLLQAEGLLVTIRAAAGEAEAALAHFNSTTNNAPLVQQAALHDEGRSGGAGWAHAAAGDAAGAPAGAPEPGAATAPTPPAAAVAGEGLGAALFCGQAAVALHRLAADLRAGIACCRELQQQLASVLDQAVQLTGHSSSSSSTAGSWSRLTAAITAVPRDAVFPLFASAGQLHHALTGELRLLLVRARLWEATCEALTTAADTHPNVPRVLGFQPRRQSTAYSSSSSSSTTTTTNINNNISSTGDAAAGLASATGVGCDLELPPGLELVTLPAPGAWAAAAEHQQLAFGGMCPVSLASSWAAGGGGGGGRGAAAAAAPPPALLLGCMARPDDSQQLGRLRFRGQLYGFSSQAALAVFCRGPAAILECVQQAARSTPLLYHLLGLHTEACSSTTAHQRPGSSSSSSSSAAGFGGCGAPSSLLPPPPPLRLLLDILEAAPLKMDAGTQTVTHVTERCIDKDYEWNEWALRRRLIALANLCHKATHSTQTLLSAFRREDGSQVWLPKEAGVQTRLHKGSSVPRKLRHVTGLRGPPTSKMAVISLDLDVHSAGVGVTCKAGGRCL